MTETEVQDWTHLRPLLEARPYLIKALQRGMAPEAAQDLYDDSLAQAFLKAGATFANEDTARSCYAVSARHFDFLAKEDFASGLTPTLEAWGEWSVNTAYTHFSREYVVQVLSGLSFGRWEAFQDEWLELTRDARANLYREYLATVDDLGLEPDMALALSTGSFVEPEVPFVEAKKFAEIEAVPRDEKGKEIKI